MVIHFLDSDNTYVDLFIHEEYLESNYLPEHLIYRENELVLLSKLFIKILDQPFSFARYVLIQGQVGIGKTAIARTFGNMMISSAMKRNIKIAYIHINCRIEKTNYKILQRILGDLHCYTPKRGFSPPELISQLIFHLQNNQVYLLLTLDEFNYIQKSDFDLIYAFTRINETNHEKNQYISLIAIVRDFTLIKDIDDSTLSTLQNRIINLQKYSKNQLFHILRERIQISLKTGVIPEDLIHYIVDHVHQSGDLRQGINIIRNSVKIAESKQKSCVELEEIHEGIDSIVPNSHEDLLPTLNFDELLILYALTTLSIRTNKIKIETGLLKELYNEFCLDRNHNTKKQTQFWQYLQNLKNLNLIEYNVESIHPRGRKSFCAIIALPIHRLHEYLKLRISLPSECK